MAALCLASAPALAAPPEKAAGDTPPKRPRLVLAGHFMLGPHESGDEACRVEGGVTICDRTGRFFGLGGSAELRLKLFRVLYLHGRFAGLANVVRTPSPLYDGALQAGGGLGVYGNMIFARGEVFVPVPLGGPEYRPAGRLEGVATDEWGPVAGNITTGLRFRVAKRWRIEPMVGLVIGPRATRTDPLEDGPKDRVILSFLAGVGMSFDVLK